MSEHNEDIKGVFDAAFAAEQVAFDPNAWAQMEALLNQRQRRRAIWMWFTGLAIFISAASWYAIDAQPALVYAPRINATQFARIGPSYDVAENRTKSNVHESSNKTSSDSDNNTAGGTNTSNMAKEFANKESADRNLNLGAETKVISVTPKNTVREELGIVSETQSIPEPSRLMNTTNMEAANDALSSTKSVVSGTESTIFMLDFMPIASFESSLVNDEIDAFRDPVQSATKRPWELYIRGGVSKTRMNAKGATSGFGQVLSVGAQKQLVAHVLVSGETGFSRTKIYDQAIIHTGTSYGYTSNENSVVVTTSEMLLMEAPLLLHYRINRIMIGAGLSPTLLLGIKNTSEELVADEITSVTTNTFDGYYRWDRYQLLGAQGILDAQFQLNNDSFLGARAKASLRNPVVDQSTNASYSQIDIYFRINIK